MAEPRDPFMESVAQVLREQVDLGPGVDARVMAELRAVPRVSRRRRIWQVLREPRTLQLSPLAGIGMAAAALVAVVVLGNRGDVISAGGVQRVEFVLSAADANQASLAGDFNNWDSGAMPLTRGDDGLWTITVPLKPGRYRYTFLVDGDRWVRDPAQPPAGDDFGAPTSVITVARR